MLFRHGDIGGARCHGRCGLKPLARKIASKQIKRVLILTHLLTPVQAVCPRVSLVNLSCVPLPLCKYRGPAGRDLPPLPSGAGIKDIDLGDSD